MAHYIDVSIVIVCMNNVKQLFPCLDSIKKYTSVSYETFVVAYLFSKENLALLRSQYPWVTIIESNEIRGFSENNNLALRQAKGKYCFILNDDTELKMPTIDRLVADIEFLPNDVAIISPNIINPDGSNQCCGRPPFEWYHWIANKLHLWKETDNHTYTNKSGLFQSYNILGAAFMIRTTVFEQLGWFDEQYFFCPEDIALSTLTNKKGYKCYVDSDAKIIHLGGMSGKSLSMTQTATLPAAVKGMIIYYSNRNSLKKYAISLIVFFITLLNYLLHKVYAIFKTDCNIYSIYSIAERNVMCSIFSNNTPKETFVHFYSKIKK